MTDDDITALPEPTRTGFVPIGKIERDPEVNTRPVNTAWVAARAKTFRPRLLGVPEVSLRADGTWIILDGQNRIALCKVVGYGPEIECKIYEGLTLKEEAELFAGLNDERPVRPGYLFLSRVTQEEDQALAIKRAAELAGWKIDTVPGQGVITATSTLDRLWRDDRKHYKNEDPFVVAETLQAIIQAWQYADKAQDRSILAGVGMLYVKNGVRNPGHGGAIDTAHLITRLAAMEGGPAELLIRAKGLQHAWKGALSVSVAELIVDDYNTGLPKGRRLPKVR